MKQSKLMLAAAAGALALSGSPALAKGCIRGAVAGGVAGHYAGHHAIAGAMAGCAAGHYYYKHKANVAAQKQAQAAHPGAAPAHQ
ncbi:hypothetical protein [uncultured Sphingomonas sp.]|uniref:hypothetical protein n=1 Tax=uncultured Sphingomonas sp. TaxID=158754 RepID=UPI002608B8AF|nr:hypothetical protein [uncultured Sphingomonas sp.]